MRGQQEQVKTALDDHDPAALADCLHMLMQDEEQAAFAEYRTFSRIQGLWLSIVENVPAEATGRAVHVYGKNHQAVSETVIEAISVLSAYCQVRLAQQQLRQRLSFSPE